MTSIKKFKRNGVIALLDILGTKTKSKEENVNEFLDNITSLYNELDEAYNVIKKLGNIEEYKRFNLDTILRTIHMNRSVNSENDVLDFKSKVRNFLKIEISTFSDTIIIALYSDIENEEKQPTVLLLYLLSYILIKIFRRAFSKRLYLRGTISCGKIYLLKQQAKLMIVGPAINEAAESHESTRWIGINTSPSALLTLDQDTEFFNSFDTIKELVDRQDQSIIDRLPEQQKTMVMFLVDIANLLANLKKYYVSYNIPNKNGLEKNGKALAWPLFDDEYIKEIEQIFKEELHFSKFQQSTIGYEIYMKWKLTKDFYDICMSKYSKIDLNPLKKYYNP